MKKNLALMAFIVFAAVLSFSVSLAANKNEVKEKITTSAVCSMCKDRIESNLKKIDGILESSLDVSSKVLTVKFDKTKISLDDIRQKLSQIGYDADNVKRDVRAYKKLPPCCKDGKY
jgi:copper chaperone CopZ